MQKIPAVTEADFSGVIVGGDLGSWNIGDEVFGMITPRMVYAIHSSHPSRTLFNFFSFVLSFSISTHSIFRNKTGFGALGQYTLVNPNLLAKKPANITHVEAAAFPFAGLTAMHILDVGGLKLGGEKKRILINGAGGWNGYLGSTNR